MSSAPQTLCPQDAWQTPHNARKLRAYMALRNQEIGERIVALRKSRHLPQSAVYDALKMSERGYQNWESGKAKPNYRSLQKLAEFFGVSESYILDGVDSHDVKGVPEQLEGVDEKFTELVAGVRAQLNLIEAKVDALAELVDRLLHMVDEGLFTPREDGTRAEQIGLGAALAAAFEANPQALEALARQLQPAQEPPQRTAGKRSRQAG